MKIKKINYICCMAVDNKYFGTGSNPFHLNLNNTAKDFSINDSTNPEYGLLNTLTKFIIVEDNIEVKQPIIGEELIIQPSPTQ